MLSPLSGDATRIVGTEFARQEQTAEQGGAQDESRDRARSLTMDTFRPDPGLTLRTYSHVGVGMQAATAELDAVLLA